MERTPISASNAGASPSASSLRKTSPCTGQTKRTVSGGGLEPRRNAVIWPDQLQSQRVGAVFRRHHEGQDGTLLRRRVQCVGIGGIPVPHTDGPEGFTTCRIGMDRWGW